MRITYLLYFRSGYHAMEKPENDKGKERGPEEEQGGQDRPRHFRQTQEYRDSLRELSATVRGRLVARGQEFKRDWLKPDITDEDLNRRWDYKPVESAPKGLKVMQVKALKDYRVALLKGKRCVWLLRAYLRQSNNERDFRRACAAAQKISEEER